MSLRSGTILEVSSMARAIEPSLIRVLRDAAGPNSLDLGIGQTDLPISPHVEEAVKRAVKSPAYAPYGPNLGLPAMREAVARHYGIDASETLITCGVQQAMSLALLGLVERGDEVLIPDPGFPAYANLVRAAGGVPVPYALREPDHDLDRDEILSRVTAKTRFILLNSPGNPTGGVHRPGPMLAILRELAGQGIGWISDEIYEDYVYEGAHVSPASDPELRTCGLRLSGLSKSHHMMGWRLGWLTGPATIVEALKPLHQHMVTSASTLIQHAGLASLAHHEAIVTEAREVFRRRRDLVYESVMKIDGLRCEKPGGAFYIWVNVRKFIEGHEQGSLGFAMDLLRQEDVVVVPGSGFGARGEDYIRLAYTIDEARLNEALDRLERFCVRRLAERT